VKTEPRLFYLRMCTSIYVYLHTRISVYEQYERTQLVRAATKAKKYMKGTLNYRITS